MSETELISIKVKWEPDEYPDLSWLETTLEDGKIIDSWRYTQEEYDANPEQVQQWISEDHKRLSSYVFDWCMMGCYAEAKIKTPINPTCGLLNTIRSGGLYGIESDSTPEHKKEIEIEELDQLKDVLETMKIDTSRFNHLTTEL